MSDAPEEIVASVDYENINGTRLRVGCVTVGTDGVPHPFDPVHYIRRDIHRALLKAEREAGEREGREKALREAVEVLRTMWASSSVEHEAAILALISKDDTP